MNPRSAPRGIPPRGGSSSGAARSSAGSPGLLSDESFVEAVLACIEAIPEGKVLAYGDIAELVGRGGPRSVGKVLSAHGGGVPWWRVLHADGSPPPGKEVRARREWIAERVPLRPNGNVDMRLARWDGRPQRG